MISLKNLYNKYIKDFWADVLIFNTKLFFLTLITTYLILSLIFFENFLDDPFQFISITLKFSFFILFIGIISRYLYIGKIFNINIQYLPIKVNKIISIVIVSLAFIWHLFSLNTVYSQYSIIPSTTYKWGMTEKQVLQANNLIKSNFKSCSTKIIQTKYQKNIIKTLYHTDKMITCSTSNQHQKNKKEIFFFRDKILTGYFILYDFQFENKKLEILKTIHSKHQQYQICNLMNPKGYFNKFIRDSYVDYKEKYIRRKKYIVEYYVDRYSIERKSIRRIQKIFSDILFMNKYNYYPDKYNINISFYDRFKQTRYVYRSQVKIYQKYFIDSLLK